MTLRRMANPVFYAHDDNGRPLVGGKLYTYEAQTSTPATTYRDRNGTYANTNPVLMDERGECVIYLDNDKEYKFVLKDAEDCVVLEMDGI